MSTLDIITTIDTMLLASSIDTQAAIDNRAHKLCLIEDVYKLEQLLGKKKSDFYLLYDYDTDIIIEYMRQLTELQLRNMRKPKTITKYWL
jgi:hypothetical protein